MVAPLVLVGGVMVAGAMTFWAAIKPSLDLSRPVMTRNGNVVRILTSQRISSDGCPIVAAVNCGGSGEVINIYTKSGVFGGTLWTLDEYLAGSLQGSVELDCSDLLNTSEPVAVPIFAEPVGIVSSAAQPPLDFSRAIQTKLGNRIRVLAMDRIGLSENRIVVMVHLQWLDIDPLKGAQVELNAIRTGEIRGKTVMEQVVNIYNKYGHFHGTVIAEAEAEQGKAYMMSPRFDMRHDMTDLCYSVF
jgi:hypothetical protein